MPSQREETREKKELELPRVYFVCMHAFRVALPILRGVTSCDDDRRKAMGFGVRRTLTRWLELGSRRRKKKRGRKKRPEDFFLSLSTMNTEKVVPRSSSIKRRTRMMVTTMIFKKCPKLKYE